MYDVPGEAFLGDLGHVGAFSFPQALTSLQAQKTHWVTKKKEQAHFSGEPGSRTDTNMAMAISASITWT